MKTAILIFLIGLLIMIIFIFCSLILIPEDEELEEKQLKGDDKQ